MATYPYNGQFGQGINNPRTGGNMNISTGRLTPNWSGGLGGNAWLKELQSVMKGLGFDYGSLSGGGGNAATGGMPANMWNFIGQATAGGGGTPLPINYSLTNTVDAINAAKPAIYEEQTRGFGNAAKRMGQTGMLASSPYMEALGGVARKSSNDIASLIENLIFQANESAAQRRLQGDIATQGDATARDIANRNRLMEAAGMAWDVNQSGDANKLAAANLLGDWYMRMREGDENRTLSYAGMPQNNNGGGSGRAPSYIPAYGSPSANRYSAPQGYAGFIPAEKTPTPASKSAAEIENEALENKRRNMEWQQLNYTDTMKPWEEKAPASASDNGPGMGSEFFKWLRSMGYGDDMLNTIKMNPQLLDFLYSKYNRRGV